MGNGGSLRGVGFPGVEMTIHLHLGPRLMINGAVTPFAIHLHGVRNSVFNFYKYNVTDD